MRSFLRLAWVCCASLVFVGCSSAVSSEPQQAAAPLPANEERSPAAWYQVAINGQPCGYAYYAAQTVGDHTTTVYEESIVESHGGERLEMYFRSTWEETLDHRPIRYTVEQRDGAATVVQTYTFTDAGIERVTRQGDRQTTTTLEHPRGEWMTPARFDVALAEAMSAGRRRIALSVWDPRIGAQPYTVVYSRPISRGQWIKAADGRVIQGTRWRVDYSYLPGMPAEEFYDAGHRLAQFRMDMGGGAVVTRTLADRSVVDAAFDPPEMGQRSVIVPDRPIEDIQRVRVAEYELSFGDPARGALDALPPSTSLQRVERLGDRRVRLTIDLDGRTGDGAADLPGEQHLAASIAVDHADPAVQSMVERVVHKLTDPSDPVAYARASSLLVSSHLRGATLSVGNATASEAARTGQGDCTECAVLLAAMLRARGIPSRCVYGLVYSEEPFLDQQGVFVFHMWTQAWIPTPDGETGAETGYWLDIDAAMLTYSAGHLALGVSAMGEDAEAEALRLVPMTADLAVKVIRVER